MRERMNINPTGANSADPQTGEKKEDEAKWNFYFFSFFVRVSYFLFKKYL
jgi:hypothetical protein